jgi:hypothetical protein
MVAKVISGKNIRGVLNYNENKVVQGAARCIGAENYGVRANELTFSDKLNRFEKLLVQNQKVKTNAIHISLNFHPSENHSDSKLIDISNAYMQGIGFGDQPYLIYRHTDAAHPHVHIVTTNVASKGKRIDIHNIGRTRSEDARKEVERRFNLLPAQGRKAPTDLPPKLVPEIAHYGKSETKRSISNIVRIVAKTYRFTSIAEFNAALRQFNVLADRGREGSSMFKHNGLQYSIIDQGGNKIGVPIKASSIYGKPTLKFLQEQFVLNEALRSQHRESLKRLIDSALKSTSTIEGLIQALTQKNIWLLVRKSPDGRIYGLTFVDNHSRCVFNGSDLGKSYAAKSIQENLDLNKSTHHSNLADSSDKKTKSPDLSFSPDISKSILLDLLTPTSGKEGFLPSDQPKKKKKKKRRSI